VLYKFLLNPNKKQDLTDIMSSATMLFADIAGFTKYSSSVSPEQVVTMLKDLFTEFDRRCLRHRVYKVYTIGDCYVVLGILDAYKRDPAEEAKNVLQMGFSMIEIIKIVRNRINFHELDMRIGIHTVR
jgi:class 3 adenylate cyclase